jgi:hypothetical protein
MRLRSGAVLSATQAWNWFEREMAPAQRLHSLSIIAPGMLESAGHGIRGCILKIGLDGHSDEVGHIGGAHLVH